MIAYFSLFLSAFVAATILPMQSEAVLVGLLLAGDYSTPSLLIVAIAGNVLGAVINWALGRSVLRWKHMSWFPASPAQLATAEGWYKRYGRWSLLLSWAPIIGDPITVIAGTLRERFWVFLLLVTVAKGGRYITLAAITLAWT